MSKEIHVGRLVLQEDDLKFPVTYDGEIFMLHYPTPFEVAQIESEIVRKLGGYTRASYSQDHLNLIEATAYVNELVIRDESPLWFKSAWTCYDPDCIYELFRGYLAFRGDFSDRIRIGKSEGSIKSDKS